MNKIVKNMVENMIQMWTFSYVDTSTQGKEGDLKNSCRRQKKTQNCHLILLSFYLVYSSTT